MATGCGEESLIVHDLMQKSKLISKGPPDRYRLLSSKSNLDGNGSVRKWTFGQQTVDMKSKILLMVGETGTGKTTLINAMVNYILGVKFTDEMWFEITEEGGDHCMSDQSKSQTTEITVYEVSTKDNPISLTIIDTPGYGDTRGTEYDNDIAENLYKLFCSETGVKEIDAVCLVVKASTNRLSDRQQYIFDAVLSLFSKDIENNIVIFVTHSDGLPPTNLINAIKKSEIPCRKDEDDEPEHFLFNNHQAEKRSKKYMKAFQAAWDVTEDSLNDFFDSLKGQNRKSLELTRNVLTETKRLEACICNLQSQIEFLACKRKELTEIQKKLQENREKIQRDENFHFTVTQHYKEKVPIKNVSWRSRKATTCSVCKENCHERNCWLAFSVKQCEIFENGHCTVCTNKCHHSKHVREDKKYVTVSKVNQVTFEELKNQYERSSNFPEDITLDTKAFEHIGKEFESNQKQAEEKTSIENRLNEEMIRTEKEKAELENKAYVTIMRLNEIALRPNSAFIFEACGYLNSLDENNEKYEQKLKNLQKAQPELQERVYAVKKYAKARFNKLKNVLLKK